MAKTQLHVTIDSNLEQALKDIAKSRNAKLSTIVEEVLKHGLSDGIITIPINRVLTEREKIKQSIERATMYMNYINNYKDRLIIEPNQTATDSPATPV